MFYLARVPYPFMMEIDCTGRAATQQNATTMSACILRQGTGAMMIMLVIITTAYMPASALSPLGTTDASMGDPIASSTIMQMDYDATTDTLYFSSTGEQLILSISPLSSMPLAPLSLALPWPRRIVAGVLHIMDSPGTLELTPEATRFKSPYGVIGWRMASARMTAASLLVLTTGSASANSGGPFVGLFVCDHWNHAVRFINFLRGGNVTTVAGSPLGNAGSVDGLGFDALLSNPSQVTTLTVSAAGYPALHYNGSVLGVVWSESSVHCLRLGVPNGVGLNGNQLVLEQMLLNVSTFAGLCGTVGAHTGLIVQVAGFNEPTGVVTVDFPAAATPAARTMVFVAEHVGSRISVIAPVWPTSARFLMVILSQSNVEGIAAVVKNVDVTTGITTIELFAATYGHVYINASISLQRDISTGRMSIRGALITTIMSGLGYTLAIMFIPWWNSTSLVLFAGQPAPVLQFYCCVDGAYSIGLRSTMGAADNIRSSSTSPTASTDSSSASHTRGVGAPSWTVSHGVSRTQSPSFSSSRSSSWQFPIHRPEFSMSNLHAIKRTATAAVRRHSSSSSFALQQQVLQVRGSMPNATTSSFVLIVGSSRSKQALALSGVISGAFVFGSSSKAVVSARLSAAWKCVATGPAEATADDSQQYLGFGAAIGSGPMGIVRGALIITSGVRLIAFGSGLLVLRQWPGTVGTVSVLVAVSVGYFLPNIVGLATQVFTADADGATIACAVGSLLGEAAMIGAVVMAVAGRGGSVLVGAAREFIMPFRRRGRWLYRAAGLEDVLATALVALVSNVPRSSEQACRTVSWALMAVCALHLLYVVALRPYRMIIDLIVSVLLAGVNAGFALLCCLAPRDDTGARMVSVGLILVTTAFYLSIALGLAAAAKLLRNPHAFTDPGRPRK